LEFGFSRKGRGGAPNNNYQLLTTQFGGVDVMKNFFLGLGLILVLLLAASCGGPSLKDFNQATNDLASLNATYQQVNNNLQRVNNELQQVNSDLQVKTAEVDSLNDSNNETQTRLNKVKIELAIYNAVFIPALTGELNNAGEEEQQKIMDEIEADINLLDDPIMLRKYNQMKFSGDSDATAEFFLYILQDMENTLK
jgi:septal ring factor EnvC (AmiA/AmiB activator)